MAKDPVCGMEVQEEGAKYMLHFEHETCYFCSERCKESYEEKTGMKRPAEKGAVKRFLAWVAGGTQESYGGKPPKCH